MTLSCFRARPTAQGRLLKLKVMNFSRNPEKNVEENQQIFLTKPADDLIYVAGSMRREGIVSSSVDSDHLLAKSLLIEELPC